MALGCLAALFGVKESPSSTPATGERTVPDSLPVEVKRFFFSRDENAFYSALTEATQGTTYRVFPNVRLNDLFKITAEGSRAATLGRLRDKHVDFLLVDAAQGYRPVLGIELDGRSHASERQQHRDAVKDVAFRSAGLPLLRLPSRAYSPAEVRAELHRVLPAR
ncbi:very-short-patch-repair endonuclease [Deinococcus metalli]|uniref:Very-short-patch-repair endonuclease n=1 Tax=Deinococcus metalli TaxID=1141878 RepID=A0A7W8KJS9_9DEIO|nr:DUF2726 domain-containing protein [Deinococcus metalli]MBB5378256.1 very-short-patch-repair endonuclease [Deinococcus metalli]GHF57215.1 hypothetical protein GCM10017781_36950 [Deinococcus metalli]